MFETQKKAIAFLIARHFYIVSDKNDGASQHTGSLILLDVIMPNMNGIEFCRMLRQNEDTEDVKVIIASAYLSPEARSDIAKLAVDVVLEKPVRLGSIVAAVEKCTDLKLK